MGAVLAPTDRYGQSPARHARGAERRPGTRIEIDELRYEAEGDIAVRGGPGRRGASHMTRPSVGLLPFTKGQRRLGLTPPDLFRGSLMQCHNGCAKASGAPFPPLAHSAVSSRRLRRP